MNIAITNIATGEYKKLFKDFYISMRDKFALEHNKTFIIYTEDIDYFNDIVGSDCRFVPITNINVEDKDYIKFRKFNWILRAEETLKIYDYILFLNGNYICNKPTILEELTGGKNLFITQHPSWLQGNRKEGLSNDVESDAYFIPKKNDIGYIAGGLFGGTPSEIIRLANKIESFRCSDCFSRKDTRKSAPWHDETYLNKVIRTCYSQDEYNLVTDIDLICPEGSTNYNNAKLILRDKGSFFKSYKSKNESSLASILGIDHIYIISSPTGDTRLPRVLNELIRLGLITSKNDDNLSIYRYSDTKINEIVKNNTKIASIVSDNNFNATLSHYIVYNESLKRGFNRVLILEDDARFLKDVVRVVYTISRIPRDADMCMLDWLPYLKPDTDHNTIIKELRLHIENSHNELFTEWYPSCDFSLSSCIVLSKNALSTLVGYINESLGENAIDNKLLTIDRYFTYDRMCTRGLKCLITNRQLAIQSLEEDIQTSSVLNMLYSIYRRSGKNNDFNFANYSNSKSHLNNSSFISSMTP